jgi:hypothetical protein
LQIKIKGRINRHSKTAWGLREIGAYFYYAFFAQKQVSMPNLSLIYISLVVIEYYFAENYAGKKYISKK